MKRPDQEGKAGRAWLIPESKDPEHAASLASWLVNVPEAHPYWEWWLLSVVHLRSVPGVAEPKLLYPGAQYELAIITLDPEDGPSPDKPEGFLYFHPPDVTEQFSGVADAEATLIGGLSTQALVEGRIFPNAEEDWKKLLTETVLSIQAGHQVLN